MADEVNVEETPEEIEAERKTIVKRVDVSLDRLSIEEPERAVQIVEARAGALMQMRRASFRMTVGSDWTASRTREGRLTCTLRKSGAEKVAKVWGISVRPRGPVTTRTEDGRHIAEIFVDAYCAVTHEEAPGLRGYRVSTEQFTGRGRDSVGVEDLKQAAQTSALTKAVRVLAAMSSVTPDEIAAAWDCSAEDVAKRCVQGAGFGSAKDRQQNAVAENQTGFATQEQLKRLWRLACNRGETVGIKPPAIWDAVRGNYKIASERLLDAQVPMDKYEDIARDIEAYNPPGAK